MSPTSQSRQSSYSGRGGMLDVHAGIVNLSGGAQPQYISTTSSANNSPKLLGSSTNVLASTTDPSSGLQGPPRISSAYRRTLETHAGNQSGSIDLDTFEVPCPVSANSPRAYRFSSTASTGGDGGNGPLVDERSGRTASVSSNKNGVSSNVPPAASVAGNVPDLGVVDLSDGKNKERPQRFKAVIHFKRKDRHPTVANQDESP